MKVERAVIALEAPLRRATRILTRPAPVWPLVAPGGTVRAAGGRVTRSVCGLMTLTALPWTRQLPTWTELTCG